MSRIYIRSKTGIILTGITMMFISSSVLSQGKLDELGRLFTDAAQREKLDAVRRGTYNVATEQKSTVSTVKVNGIMMRSDGENVVWVNGESTLVGNPAQGVKVYPKAVDSETFEVPVKVDGKRTIIKPGQNWSENTRQITDNY